MIDFSNVTFVKKSLKTKFKKDFHMESIHGDKKFECYLCNELLSNPNTLEYHKKRVHGNIKNQRCDLCEKHFFSIADLNDHIRNIHSKANS